MKTEYRITHNEQLWLSITRKLVNEGRLAKGVNNMVRQIQTEI